MISVFLDESGNFEYKGYKLKFIGGLIYTGEDLKEERNRLENFFKKTCEKLNIVYPRGMHTTESNEIINKYLRDNLLNYIFNNGKYHFTYMIWGSSRKNYINNNSNIVEDEVASNLYDNMIANLVQNILFYNPYLSDKKYYLNIATRVAFVLKSDKLKIEEYNRLGYIYTFDSHGNYIYFLNDNKSIKAAISSNIIANRINKDIDTIELKVEKCNYKNSKRDEKLPTTPFLYAADIACNIIKQKIVELSDPNNSFDGLKEKIKNLKRRDLYIHETVKELESSSGNKAFAWAYDDIEGLWQDLNLAIYREDFLLALDYLYDIKTDKSAFSKFYYEFWQNKILHDIYSIFNKDELNLYITKIETYCLNKDRAKYEKGLFIAEHIKNLISSSNIKNKNYYTFKLNDILLRGFNHRGDTLNGHECAEICKNNRDYVSTDEYISFLIRSLQVYVNEFNYGKCIETSNEIELYLDILKSSEEEIARCLNKKATGNIQRGKVLSSIGQFYGFKKNKEKALDYFKRALSEFKGSDINTRTTISYILHLAIDNNDYQLYKEYSKHFWKSSTLEDIFQEIVDNRDRFGLYVYLKAINTFYMDNLSCKLWEKILRFDYKNNGFEQVHPWELIYKYMAIISLKKGYIRESENNILRIDKIENIAETIKLININSKIQYYKLYSDLNNINVEDKINKQLKNMAEILDKYPNIKDVFRPIIIDSNTVNVDKLYSIFTFMYR